MKKILIISICFVLLSGCSFNDNKSEIPKVEKSKEENQDVIRYGDPFISSSSGDMRFIYFDMENKVLLKEWNGYPWFWGAGEEKDINYVENHKNYVFKITGEKEADDCGYYDNGICLENITVKNIEAVFELTPEMSRNGLPDILTGKNKKEN